MTFIPALPSSAARIPPAAPAPTMTTSVFSIAMTRASASALGLRLQAGHGYPRECLSALHVGRGECRLRAREADQTPAGEILVAAIDRVREHALDGVRTQRVEEGARARPGKSAGFAGLERRDHLVLRSGTQLDEGLAIGRAAVLIERGESPSIEILEVCIGAGERKINVIGDVRVACAWLAWRARHQPLGEGRNGCGIVLVEKRAKPAAARMLVAGSR